MENKTLRTNNLDQTDDSTDVQLDNIKLYKFTRSVDSFINHWIDNRKKANEKKGDKNLEDFLKNYLDETDADPKDP